MISSEDFGSKSKKVSQRHSKRTSPRPARGAAAKAKAKTQKWAADDDDSAEDAGSGSTSPVPAATKKAAVPVPAPAALRRGSPFLTDEEIIAAIGVSVFVKGLDYAHTRLKDMSDDEASNTISCTCKGTEPEAYVVSVTISNDKKLQAWSCTCPLGKKSTICKHVGALLVTWQELRTGEKKDRSKHPDEDQAKIDTFVDKFTSLTVPRLKEMLKANDQPVTGTKSELLARCAEGAALGALPRCPKCQGGRIRFKAGAFICPGFMDDDLFRECDYFNACIARLPWQEQETAPPQTANT